MLTSLAFLSSSGRRLAPAVLIKAQWHEVEQNNNMAQILCGGPVFISELFDPIGRAVRLSGLRPQWESKGPIPIWPLHPPRESLTAVKDLFKHEDKLWTPSLFFHENSNIRQYGVQLMSF